MEPITTTNLIRQYYFIFYFYLFIYLFFFFFSKQIPTRPPGLIELTPHALSFQSSVSPASKTKSFIRIAGLATAGKLDASHPMKRGFPRAQSINSRQPNRRTPDCYARGGGDGKAGVNTINRIGDGEKVSAHNYTSKRGLVALGGREGSGMLRSSEPQRLIRSRIYRRNGVALYKGWGFRMSRPVMLVLGCICRHGFVAGNRSRGGEESVG
ncbi:hypothetical protein LI328DRAFT_52024 [Trichoderma asperelloides]|nr:hypothetical protein LI328DRAFT_52024 [Trichoderma asperelloides]